MGQNLQTDLRQIQDCVTYLEGVVEECEVAIYAGNSQVEPVPMTARPVGGYPVGQA